MKHEKSSNNSGGGKFEKFETKIRKSGYFFSATFLALGMISQRPMVSPPLQLTSLLNPYSHGGRACVGLSRDTSIASVAVVFPSLPSLPKWLWTLSNRLCHPLSGRDRPPHLFRRGKQAGTPRLSGSSLNEWGHAKGAEKASCGETFVQKGVFGESVSSLPP